MNFNDLLRLQAAAAAAANANSTHLMLNQQALQDFSVPDSHTPNTNTSAGQHLLSGNNSNNNRKRKGGPGEGKLLLPSADLDHSAVFASSSNGGGLAPALTSSNHNNSSSSNNNNNNNNSNSANKKRYVWPESLHRDFIGAVFDVGLKVASLNEIQGVLSEHPSAASKKFNMGLDKSFDAQFLKLRLYRDLNLFPRQTYYDQELGLPFNAQPGQGGHDAEGDETGPTAEGGAEEEQSEAEDDNQDQLNDIQAAAFDAKTALAYDTTITAISQHLSHLLASIDYEENLLRNLQSSLPRHYIAYQSLLNRLQDIDPVVAKPFLDRPPPSFLSFLTQSDDDDKEDQQDLQKLELSSSSSSSSEEGTTGLGKNSSGLDYDHRSARPTLSRDNSDHSASYYQHSHAGSQHGPSSHHVHTYTHTHDDSTHTHEHSHEHSHMHAHEHRNNSLDDLLQPLSSSRTELNIMYEMRAQMDLHRKLLEKKETQLLQHGGSTINLSNNNLSGNNLVQAIPTAEVNFRSGSASSSTGSIMALENQQTAAPASGGSSQSNSQSGSTNAAAINPGNPAHLQDWDSETFELTDLFSFLHEPL